MSKAEILHKTYCREMGIAETSLPLSAGYLYGWELFALKFSPDELVMLIRHIKSKGKHGRSLLPRNLITGPCSIDHAYEDLAEARANRRAWTGPGKASVMHATGRRQASAEPRHVAEIMPNKTEQEWREFFDKHKRENGLI